MCIYTHGCVAVAVTAITTSIDMMTIANNDSNHIKYYEQWINNQNKNGMILTAIMIAMMVTIANE